MNKRVLVISAVGCPSCLILKKNLKELKKTYSNLNIETLDYDFDEEEVKKYNVGKVLPVIISLNNDEEINRLIGEKSYNEIVDFLKESEVI